MNKRAAWVHAARPKTLAAAAAPVLIGSALAYRNGFFEATAATVALFCALLIQIGTNFANDYFDFKKGADTPERIGFQRAVASGWISPGSMYRATLLTMGLAFFAGLFLVYQAGWPVLLLGIASIVCGLAYTGGPFPLGYNGLGDLFVMLFFGQAAVLGTVFVQQLEWTAEALLWSFGPGALAVNILVLNNLRDIETDVKAGKRTLGVLFGPGALLTEYAAMLLLACVAPVVATGFQNTAIVAVAGLTLGTGGGLFRKIMAVQEKRELNPLLEKTAQLLALYGVAMTLALVFTA